MFIVKKISKAEQCSANKGFHAFSLVEMLMALLVASLLLAALAPVMTRRMADHELKVLSEASNYEKDMVVSVFTESTKFNIPSDANQVRVTLMGGGGKGGDALYGNKIITSSETNWTVPEGVTKLRVFLIGAGGGGASGGSGTAWETADIPSLSNAEGEILTAGSYTFANGITPPDSYKAPELDNKCKVSNISDKWTIVSDNAMVEADKKFAKFPNDINITLSKVTACGAGGGGGNYRTGGGGTGGYIANQNLSVSNQASNILLRIGSGGEQGGSAGGYSSFSAAGGKGGSGYGSGNGVNGTSVSGYNANYTYGSAGAGGGGATTLLNSTTQIFQIGGGGGGAGCYSTGSSAGPGGKGGGTGAGAGGTTGAWVNSYYRGNGGGGGTGGTAGGTSYESKLAPATIATSIFNKSTNCSGGGNTTGGAGLPGAIHLWYSAASVKDGLKCEYYTKSNSGSGGGAGQIWIGELSVTPGEKLNFNIGIGGNRTTSYGANGNNGGSTSITNNNGTTLISVSGGKGGKYESDETYINNSYGIGGGIKTSNVDSSLAKYVNWKKTNFHTGGENGGVGKTPSNGAGGGKGGQLYDLNGTLLKGGIEGGAQSNGSDALITNYGTGGGGGGGVINDGGTPGLGGKGANGYIYVEWGGTNGGGGTVGEIVKKTYTNLDPDPKNRVIDIKIGLGGGAKSSDYEFDVNEGINGNGGITSTSMISNGKTTTFEAKGGLKGNNGTSEEKVHGEETKIPSNFSEIYKEYIQPNTTTAINSSITSGQKGEDNYGGMGGYLSCLYQTKDEEGNSICASTIKSNDGNNITLGPIRPGCGGTSILSPLYDSICNISNQTPSPHGNNGLYGAGGGGGAVLNQTGGIGGNGGNGFVILEYKSTTLD